MNIARELQRHQEWAARRALLEEADRRLRRIYIANGDVDGLEGLAQLQAGRLRARAVRCVLLCLPVFIIAGGSADAFAIRISELGASWNPAHFWQATHHWYWVAAAVTWGASMLWNVRTVRRLNTPHLGNVA